MKNGKLIQICIAPKAGAPMEFAREAYMVEGKGIQGDRYALGQGSFNKNKEKWNGQVTLMNARFFENSSFQFSESRRNLLIQGAELMRCIGHQFTIGEVKFYGYKYCEPCRRPSNLLQKTVNFDEEFYDCGGLIATVLTSGIIRLDDAFIPPPKNY